MNAHEDTLADLVAQLKEAEPASFKLRPDGEYVVFALPEAKK